MLEQSKVEQCFRFSVWLCVALCRVAVLCLRTTRMMTSMMSMTITATKTRKTWVRLKALSEAQSKHFFQLLTLSDVMLGFQLL